MLLSVNDQSAKHFVLTRFSFLSIPSCSACVGPLLRTELFGSRGILGDVGVRGFGIRASSGRKFYMGSSDNTSDDIGGDDGMGNSSNPVEGANKLYVGMLIMLIFSEALALYGLIVALILSQHSYLCIDNA
jgi:hypothetical protein